MRLEYIRALPGPNVYVYRPVLCARVELEALAERESREFAGFNTRLLAHLPGLADHHCAKGAPGGLLARLEDGTYFGHITEHVALELQNRAGSSVSFGKTLYAGAAGRYDMIIEYASEALGRFLVPVAMELVQALLDDQPYPLDAKLDEARHILAATELGPSTRAIVDAAERRDIPWLRLNDASLVQLGYGVHRRLVAATQSDRTSVVASDIACDKALTKQLLAEASIPVPHGIIARSRAEAVAALDALTPPLVVKPLDGNQGRGVSLRLRTAQEIALAYDLAAEVAPTVIVEEYFAGRDYRVVVVGAKLVAASERVPAHVIGDGEHTLAKLIERENQNPLRGDDHDRPLTKITIDALAESFLARGGRRLDDTPGRDERVFLRETANLSTGGTARDVTDDVHPTVARLCERAARVIGLDICGVDLILHDIAQPMPSGGAGIVEVNAAPGIRMHHHPAAGRPRDVGGAIVSMLLPTGPGRIPITSVTGTNGKTTVVRMIGHVLAATGKTVGVTTTDGIWIGGHCVAQGDLTGFHSARTVLSDPSVEVAVLETARGGIVRRSLGYDWSDIGILTNIQADHLGQDGIETVNDLLWVKALVAERVRAGGTLILNADDERLVELPQESRVTRLPRRIVYFALGDDHPLLRRHLARGGTAFLLDGDWLVEATGDDRARIVHARALPVTFGGMARFQIANVLAALAACRAHGISAAHAAAALADFDGGRCNPGRMNLYRVGPGYVIVDYAHNAGAFEALVELTARWHDRRVTGVYTVPGDRPDELITDAGRLAARCFDRLIIREDEDPRGRKAGAVAQLLYEAARAEAPEKDCRIIPDEGGALLTALEEMEEDEVVLFIYEKRTEPHLDLLRRHGGHAVTAIEPRLALQPS
jgi:cyanophycin synthetase